MHSRFQLLQKCPWGQERARDLEGHDVGLGFKSTSYWGHVIVGKALGKACFSSPENDGPKACPSHGSSKRQWNDVSGNVLQTEKGRLGTGFPPGELGARLL